MKGAGGDEESFEREGELVGVHLGKAGEQVETGGERILPDEVVTKELHDGCFQSAGAFFVEACGRKTSKGR